MNSPQIEQRRLKMPTNIEQAAWKLSDTLAKTIEYLHKTDLNETTRRKMIRDILKDNFVNFYTQHSDTRTIEE